MSTSSSSKEQQQQFSGLSVHVLHTNCNKNKNCFDYVFMLDHYTTSRISNMVADDDYTILIFVSLLRR